MWTTVFFIFRSIVLLILERSRKKEESKPIRKGKKGKSIPLTQVPGLIMEIDESASKKSTFWAYFWWLFGGIFGAHHYYLGRDENAFVWFTSFGGYFGFGCLWDLYKIPTYVADANNDHKFLDYFKLNVRHNQKPPFSIVRFFGGLITGYFWGSLVRMAVPEDEIYGINFRPLLLLLPAAVALGVWIVGNIGREQGSIWGPLIFSYIAYPSLYYVSDESTWMVCMVMSAACGFDSFSKEWRLKPRKKRTSVKRFSIFASACCIYLALWASFLYFNAEFTDSEGEEIKLSDTIKNFFKSPIWMDVKTTLHNTWDQMKEQGFSDIWGQLMDMSDPRGETNAYRVLGLSVTASQSEVTAKWRRLSKEFHPDKVKGTEEDRRAAQEKFMEIQQAYEILSNVKSRRQRKNRRSG